MACILFSVVCDFYVYCWTNLTDGKCYIGKGRGRRYLHPTFASGKSLVHRAYRKYGADNFCVEMLHEGLTDAEALRLEILEIARHVSKTPTGYNLTDGGDGMGGYKQKPEHVAKLKAARAVTQKQASQKRSQAWDTKTDGERAEIRNKRAQTKARRFVLDR